MSGNLAQPQMSLTNTESCKRGISVLSLFEIEVCSMFVPCHNIPAMDFGVEI